MTVIGVTAGQLTVENAIVNTLEKYLAYYVVAAARRYAAEGVFDLTVEEMEELLAQYTFPFKPRGISVAKSFEDWDTQALPWVQVLSPSWKIAGGSQGGRSIEYEVQIASLVGAQEKDDTRLLRACFEDGILGAIDQHQSLGNIAQGINIVGGGSAAFSEMSGADEQTFQGSIAVFEVLLENVVDPFDGPGNGELPAPDENDVPTPWPEDPVFEGETGITYEPEAVDGDS
jgi:hypothetical protein